MATKTWSSSQKGTYSAGTAYTIGDFVVYSGSSYTCIANSTGNLPTNGTYFALVVSKGDTGADGPQGIQGIQGIQGEQGPAGSGTGDVIGPASATDNAIARFDLTTGKIIQNSAATIADTNGDITAGKYNTVAISGTSTPTLAITGTTTVSGSNTGDNTVATALTGTPSITVATVTTTGNIELGHATDTTISRTGAGAIAVEGVAVPTISSTSTLTNKRINPRLVTATSYTTDTGTSLDVSTCDQFEVTAQAGALKLNNPNGTPTGGQKLIVRLKDNGTARALTYDTQFRAMGVALPTTTVLSKTMYLGFIFNATDTKWDLVSVAQEA